MKYTLAFLLSLLATPALAEEPQHSPCGPIDEVEAWLAKNYQEVRTIQGVTDQGPLFLVYSSKDGATFTVVMVRAEDKKACMVASGSNLVSRPYEAPKDAGEGL